MGWAGATPRPPDDPRITARDVAVADRDDVALTAHDFRTLLAIMVRCVDAMRHPDAEDDFREFHRAAERMDRVAEQLISLQKTEMGPAEPVDLNQVVEESEGMLKRAIAPGISVRLQVGAARGLRVRARRWDLERILLHVVINAARDIASGDVIIDTSLTPQVRPSATLVVAGSGSAPASSTRIISRSSTGQRESDLGIAAVARLVQRLNGVLQFESDSERRTRIQVDFPLVTDNS
jgi:signal transduction histidine kinase